MLPAQRAHLAGLATGHIAGLFQDQPGTFYEDSLRHKLIMVLQAVDRAALATDRPILFAELVPGFDLVVMRNPDLPTPAMDAEALDARAVSAVDDSCLAMVAQALNKQLALRADNEAGTFVFEGEDGLFYFGFRTLYRAAVLKQMGVSEDGLVTAPTGEALQ